MRRSAALLFFLFHVASGKYYCNPPAVDYTEGYCLMPGGIDTFYNAQLRCLNSGGFLPSVLDDSSNEVLFQQMQIRDSCMGSWLGLDRRNIWTDGNNLNYTKWAATPAGGKVTSCTQMLKSSGTWSEADCFNERMGFFCIVKADTNPVTPAPFVCNAPQVTLPAPRDKFPCKLNEHCGGHWRVIALVAATHEESYLQAINLLETFTSPCSKSDEVVFLSPGKMQKSPDCGIDKLTSDYFSNQKSAFPFSTADEKATGDDVMDMLEIANSCSSLNSKTGGVVYLFTDVECHSLCISSNLKQNQSILMSSLIDAGYVVEIIKMNTTNDCVSTIFNQCDHWDETCVIYAATSSSLKQICVPYKMETWLIVLIVLICVFVVVAIIAAIVIRILLKRHGGWSRFWQDMARGKSNSYTMGPEKIFDEWEIDRENLEIYLERELGSGAFGVVYEGHLTGKRPVDFIVSSAQLTSGNFTGKVAVKRVPPHADLLAKRDFEDEVRFMKKLGYHSHVLGMIGCLLSADLPLMVLELCEHGDLLGFIRGHRDTFKIDDTGSIKSKDLVSISWQICDGLCYLKSLDLIHRDLAARNVLLTKDLVAKVSDFGLCRQAETTDSASIYVSRGGRLPVKWMAPESLRDFHFTFKTDVWSFGVVLWETFTLGDAPFEDVHATTMLEALDDGVRLQKTETIPEAMYNVMMTCWAQKAEDRKDIDELRDDLAELLNSSANYYGYVALSHTSDVIYVEDEEDIREVSKDDSIEELDYYEEKEKDPHGKCQSVTSINGMCHDEEPTLDEMAIKMENEEEATDNGFFNAYDIVNVAAEDLEEEGHRTHEEGRPPSVISAHDLHKNHLKLGLIALGINEHRYDDVPKDEVEKLEINSDFASEDECFRRNHKEQGKEQGSSSEAVAYNPYSENDDITIFRRHSDAKNGREK